MELRTIRELRRSGQLNKAISKKADTAGSPDPAQAPRQQAPADKLNLSRQALAFLDEQSRAMWDAAQEREQRRQSRVDGGLSALEGAKQELDAMSKRLKVQNKCQKIAASIMRGDRVPPEDLEYLMNNDPEGYKLAMAMRRAKKNPEDCESVLDDEDREARSAAEDGGEEAPSVSASGAASGGGEASAPGE